MVSLCSLEEVWRMLVMNCEWIIRELPFADLFDDLHKRKIAYCDIVWNNRRNALNFCLQVSEKKQMAYCGYRS
jgi:hypothetical protein